MAGRFARRSLILGLAFLGVAAMGRGAGGEPVAEVDGQVITSDEVEQGLGPQLRKLEEQAHVPERQKLDTLIAERLLAREAGRRGVSVQALLDAEVTSKVGPVTEQEIDAFYEAKEPPRPIVSVEGAPSRGPAGAAVTIVEFSDHCPFCRAVEPTIREVLARYPDKGRLVYRDFPLDNLHPGARRAAEAARCATDQGKFWPYHDLIYSKEPDGTAEEIERFARQVGLDVDAFEACLASGKHRARVQKDLEEGMRLGVEGTPAFFVNGRLLSGAQPLEAFTRIIDEELARPR